MTNRHETTTNLSAMLEKYLDPHNDPRIYWAKEVTFDYATAAPSNTCPAYPKGGEIDNEPTVDAVPVVRCRNCKYHSGRIPGQPNIICFQMHEDDFCSYGEPKEDTNE